MAYSRGRDAVRRYFLTLPAQIEDKILRRAARAGADVIAERAKETVRSDQVAKAIKVTIRAESGHVEGVVHIDRQDRIAGALALWLEYGTDPHFISVDDLQSEGKSATRINRLAKSGLFIAGKPIGRTIFHPGAQAYPFLRPARDMVEDQAIAAAQRYIDRRAAGAAVPEGEQE